MKSGFVISLLLMVINLSAQINSNYWSHQFGTSGQLLNGAVIANVDDETAIFYNPGAFAQTDHTGVSLSLITPTYSVVRTTNFLGDDTSLSDRDFGLAPGLVAASFKPFDDHQLIIGATIFKRFQADIDYNDRIVTGLDEDRFFNGQLEMRKRVRETWAGGALSYQVFDNFSIGVSHFFTFRSEDFRLAFSKEILSRSNPDELIKGWQNDFSYGYGINGGMTTKFGLVWDAGKVKIGVTYTLPLETRLFSNAQYAIDEQKTFGPGDISSIANARSVDLNEYQTPRSLGLGVSFQSGETEVSLSAEYFGSTETYSLINDIDDPNDGQSAEVILTTVNIVEESQEVLNLAIGCKKELSDTKDWFYGFRTDLSPKKSIDLGSEISFLSLSPDIFHVSTGIASKFREINFSIGVDYGLGVNSGGQQLINLSDTDEDSIFMFTGKDVVDTYSQQLSLFLTYEF